MNRNWRQLSLRSAVLLIVLLSLAGAIWNHFVSGFHRQSRVVAELRQLGVHLQLRSAIGPEWLRRAVGEKDFFDVVSIGNVRPHDGKLISASVVLEKLHYVRILEQLWIRGPVSDADLRYISHLKTLRRLFLIDSEISDQGLIHLKSLKNLRMLTLSGSRVSDEGLVQLDLSNLQEFVLASPNVKGYGLRGLRDCASLTHLDFSSESATNEWLQEAGPPRSLLHVTLYRTNVDDRGAALLENCPHLRSAWFLYSPIGETALDRLICLKELETVWNYGTNISPAMLKQFNATRRSMELKPVSLLE